MFEDNHILRLYIHDVYKNMRVGIVGTSQYKKSLYNILVGDKDVLSLTVVPTIGIESCVKKCILGDCTHLWTCATDRRFEILARQHYRDTDLILCVWNDDCNPENADSWCYRNIPAHLRVLVLVQNSSSLRPLQKHALFEGWNIICLHRDMCRDEIINTLRPLFIKPNMNPNVFDSVTMRQTVTEADCCCTS
jgi:hypothetical protein